MFISYFYITGLHEMYHFVKYCKYDWLLLRYCLCLGGFRRSVAMRLYAHVWLLHVMEGHFVRPAGQVPLQTFGCTVFLLFHDVLSVIFKKMMKKNEGLVGHTLRGTVWHTESGIDLLTPAAFLSPPNICAASQQKARSGEWKEILDVFCFFTNESRNPDLMKSSIFSVLLSVSVCCVTVQVNQLRWRI